MKIKGIDHVGVIVASLERAEALLEAGFGFVPVRRVDRVDLKATFMKCGVSHVELIEIIDPVKRRERLGEGREAQFEHIALEVDDLQEALATLHQLGIRTTGPPQATSAYTSVMTDAATSGGVMYQFLERPTASED
jgi:catechol 2,3-dioxygenase-like lactoylglutathione lyase family enzyme